MDTQLIAFGIKAILRAAQAGVDLYAEHARDRNIFLPDLDLPEGTRPFQLQRFLTDHPQLATTDKFADIWDSNRKALKINLTAEKLDAAYIMMLQHKATIDLEKEGKDTREAEREAKMLAGGRMVEQWREERKPPSAAVRMALTLTDIGLEFVSSNPSILGLGSRGEKLIGAFANNLSTLIPDDVTTFDAKVNFADRVLGIFLRAGLGTIAGNAAIVFRDEDIAKLVAGVAKPIVDELPDSLPQQIAYRDIVDVLAGPAAAAAFHVLAENTETYFGKDFANDKALGAVTSALFKAIKETALGGTIVDVFSEQGAIRLYQAGLGVAVERPNLFIKDNQEPLTQLFHHLLKGAAATLQANPKFNGPLGASLAAMTVEAVGRNAPALLKLHPEEPWDEVAVKALDQIATSLAEALKGPAGAIAIFSDDQLLELGRVVLAQVAQTPGMLGMQRSEVKAIVAGMAAAMAKDDTLLLSSDEWINIAGIAAQLAAANPGRLFGLSAADDPGQALAVKVIASVLKAAGDTWTADGRKDHPLLFGVTLASALASVLEALAGNVSGLAHDPLIVDQFLKKLLADASANPNRYGSEGLLRVFRTLIKKVLASGVLPTDSEINAALAA